LPIDATGSIIGGTAIGALGVGGLFALAQYMKLSKKEKQAQDTTEDRTQDKAQDKAQDKPNEDTEPEDTSIRIRLNEGLSYLCVNTSDLEFIKVLLTEFRTRYHVLGSIGEEAPATLRSI
jgi:hypothetical protein